MSTYYTPNMNGTKFIAMQYNGTNTSDILDAINATQPNGWPGNGNPGGPGHFSDDGSGNLTVTATAGYSNSNIQPFIPGSLVTAPVPVGWWVVWASVGTYNEVAACVSDTDFIGIYNELA
ncbi:MAG TPA: hypothetical protein VLT90_12945 [Terriglobales bacterium]|nr:hypothetical protein [Terriglobales bacterium]